MRTKRVIQAVLASTAALAAESPVHDVQAQQPLRGSNATSDLIDELKKADIIPQILNDFVPQLTVAAFWHHATSEVGNTVDPKLTQKEPKLELISLAAEDNAATLIKPGVQLTVALTDPDAPSRDDPKWSQMCHWIATNVSLMGPGLVAGKANDGIVTIMPYKAPGPPPKTGKHRYILVALAPKNGTTETLRLEKPSDRQFWGYARTTA